jgi:hypothetical protein
MNTRTYPTHIIFLFLLITTASLRPHPRDFGYMHLRPLVRLEEGFENSCRNNTFSIFSKKSWRTEPHAPRVSTDGITTLSGLPSNIITSFWKFSCFDFFFPCLPQVEPKGLTAGSKVHGGPKWHHYYFRYSCGSYEETKVPNWGCAYLFWFKNWITKNIIVLSCQCLAAAGDMLHCFSLQPAKSAGWIPNVQAHSLQMSSYLSMYSEICSCHF